MKPYVWVGMLTIMVGMTASGCSSVENATAQNEKTAAKTAGRPPVAVEVTSATLGDQIRTIEVVGSLVAKYEAGVKAEIPGPVVEVKVNEWVRVKKGDPLARLDTREIELDLQRARAAVESAKADVLRAEVTSNRAQREFERVEKLNTEGVSSQQNIDDARKEKEAAAAELAAARARVKTDEEGVHQAELRLAKAVIAAPLSGVISQRKVNVGDYVEANAGSDPLFRIVDNSLLNLTLTVPSTQLGAVKIDQPITFTTDAVPGKTFTGKVMYINPSADPGTRSVKVIAEVPNESEELRAGLFVKGRIEVGRRTGILRIPRTALVTWDGKSGNADLFIVEGAQARRRTIKTGESQGDMVEVLSGIAPKDNVITRGSFNLRDGDALKIASSPTPQS